jgi:hypothetical protein
MRKTLAAAAATTTTTTKTTILAFFSKLLCLGTYLYFNSHISGFSVNFIFLYCN